VCCAVRTGRIDYLCALGGDRDPWGCGELAWGFAWEQLSQSLFHLHYAKSVRDLVNIAYTQPLCNLPILDGARTGAGGAAAPVSHDRRLGVDRRGAKPRYPHPQDDSPPTPDLSKRAKRGMPLLLLTLVSVSTHMNSKSGQRIAIDFVFSFLVCIEQC